MELRLEVVHVPVADADRAKSFYTENVGFDVDHDTELSETLRVIQLTPPGSACSIVIGTRWKCSAAPAGGASSTPTFATQMATAGRSRRFLDRPNSGGILPVRVARS
jgi:catechol 2,3-dioxygenase-like lactoylglutathione lyase family enzyme